MSKREIKVSDTRVKTISFPWLSALAGLLAVSYLLLITESELVSFYDIPFELLQSKTKYAVCLLFLLLVLRDLHRYHCQLAHQETDLQELRNQVRDLWRNKKQLQIKAHTYSGHADKLKLFISDKLLEHIEYDEKFLHFKSIAAEVRHNGVISFDKVQTALQKMATAKPREDASQPATDDAKSALNAMRYLWDLLDLSTADNLALHIGNLLCECEEHLYQRVLNLDNPEPLPYEPIYSVQHAAWRALGLVCNTPLPDLKQNFDWMFDDGRWRIHLAPAGELLGNENHLVLLLENLLKNAQFFSQRRGYKSTFPAVALTVTEQKGRAHLRIYNRGPHVLEEDMPNLFQLGFSTRRAREHNGRGLGLYFVSEIVKGYEGRIMVHNVHSPETQYTMRIEQENGEVLTELIDVVVNEGMPYCSRDDEKAVATQEWTLKSPLRSVEVTAVGNPLTQRLQEFSDKDKQNHFDPGHPEYPHWQLKYEPRRGAYRLSFTPLDIRGIEFEVRLPTAQQRLEGGEPELDDIDAEVERLDERFRAQATFDTGNQ